MTRIPELVPIERIENKILLIRGRKVILDADLAKLYGVTTKQLNQQVKRNKARFPEDFMFRINKSKRWRWSQFVTTSRSSSFPHLFRMRLPSMEQLWPPVFLILSALLK